MKSDILKTSLLAIGLSDFSCQVYGELLKNEDLNITALSRILNSYRVKIYSSLDELGEFGLIKNKAKDYDRKILLENPSSIIRKIKEKQSKLSLIENRLNEYLPQIQNEYYSSRKQPITKIYEGITQFKLFFDLILEEAGTGSQILVIGDGPDFEDIVTAQYFLENWMARRLEKQIKVRILAKYFNQRLRKIAKKNEIELREIKFLDETFSQPGCLWITETKIINWNTILPKAIVTEDQIMVNFYKGLFESIWGKY